MAVVPRRSSVKRLALYAVAALVTYQLSKLVLPPDCGLFLIVHWLGVCMRSYLRPASSVDSWLLSSPGPYPVDFDSRVGILVKTGYGTRERLAAQLEVLGLGEWDADRAVVVADFARGGGGGRPVPVLVVAGGGTGVVTSLVGGGGGRGVVAGGGRGVLVVVVLQGTVVVMVVSQCRAPAWARAAVAATMRAEAFILVCGIECK